MVLEVAPVRTDRLFGGHHLPYLFAKIRRTAFAMVNLVIVKTEWELFEGISLGLVKFPGFDHLVDDYVPPVACAFLMSERIVETRIFEHPDKHGGFLYLQVSGFFAEVDVGGGFYSHGIVEEVESVEIHVDYLVFCIVALEFDSDHPFYRFLDGAFQKIGGRFRIQLFCKLLCYRGCTAG